MTILTAASSRRSSSLTGKAVVVTASPTRTRGCSSGSAPAANDCAKFDANGNLVRQLVNGSLVVTFTNLSNRHAITVNISGPGYATFYADGSFIQRFEGNAAIFLPNLFILTSGRVDLKTFPDGSSVIVRMSGSQRDVCALIS